MNRQHLDPSRFPVSIQVLNGLHGTDTAQSGPELDERAGKAFPTRLDFDHQDRTVVDDGQKIDFMSVFVPEVAQAGPAAGNILQSLDFPQERGGYRVFQPGPRARFDVADVIEVVLRLFEEAAGDVAVIRPDGKNEAEAFQDRQPALHGMDGDMEVAGKRRSGGRGAHPNPEQVDQDFDGFNVAHGFQIEKIAPNDRVDVGPRRQQRA